MNKRSADNLLTIGIILLIVQLVVGVKVEDNFAYTLGRNIFGILGVFNVICGTIFYIKETRERDDMKQEIKNYNKNGENDTKKINYIIFFTLLIAITITMIAGMILFFNYKNKELDFKKHQNKISQQKKDEEKKKTNLNLCYMQADQTRSELWKANCPDNNQNCSLPQSTITFIENRYKIEIEKCNNLYK